MNTGQILVVLAVYLVGIACCFGGYTMWRKFRNRGQHQGATVNWSPIQETRDAPPNDLSELAEEVELDLVLITSQHERDRLDMEDRIRTWATDHVCTYSPVFQEGAEAALARIDEVWKELTKDTPDVAKRCEAITTATGQFPIIKTEDQ